MTSIIVIGAGLAGSSAAWRLAQSGHEVTVLERSTPANDYGSSHGSARIFRYAYPDPFYVNLVQQSERGWVELGEANGSPLISPSGAVDFGSARDPGGLARILSVAGVEHELLSAEAASTRWDLAFDTDVVWQPGAGVVDAERSVEAMLAQAAWHGATVLGDWPVQRVEAVPHGYRAVSEHGESVEAEQVVVAAGGWLPDLLTQLDLPAGFLETFPALQVRQEQAFHFPYRAGSDQGWPTFIHKFPEIQIYGLPGGRDADGRGQKVAEYNGGKRIRSAAEQDCVVDPANRRRVVDYVERFVPGLIPEPYAETTCLFTNTPNEDFVIDRCEGITVLSPCSGHGAKFAPLLGELAASLVAGSDTVPERFRPGLVSAR